MSKINKNLVANYRWLAKHIMLLLLMLNFYTVTAQNITVVEYFFDTDPGYGSGTSVAITPATAITDFTFPVDIAAQTDGFHTLFVRAQDANNNWSAAYSRPFYKLSVAQVSPAAPNITKMEYFLDSDPGYGAGIDVPVTASASISDFTFAIPLSSTADGFHTLFVRTKDANNNWSAAYSRPFYKLSVAQVSPAAPNITKMEYFLDSDPGYGAGIDVPVTASASISDFTFAIPLSSTSDGFHTLFVRTQDANNNWSTAYSRPFYKLSSSALPPVPNINKLEYFIDADPGYGAGTQVVITPGVSIPDLSVSIPVTAMEEGNHIITFRARDANNNWSVVAIKTFSKCNHPGTTINAATSITSSGFTASWADLPGSISYRLDVSSDNFNTFLSGYNDKVITAPALSLAVTGLAQATTYQYRVRAVASCTSVESNTVSLTTLATPPSAQPTNLLFSSVTSTSLTAFFTTPSTAPTGYLVVRTVGSASSFIPANNTSYTLGQDTGDGIVAYIGSAFLFNETGLAPDSQYFYKVFAFNQVGTSISYMTTAPLQNNVRTPALEPTAQATNLQFVSVTDVGLTVSFTEAEGSPTGYLVVRKTGSAPTSAPVDGTTYTTTVGTDAVVYNGAATSFPQTGLTQNTRYYYTIYAYNGSGSSINYRTVSPLQGNQLTPITAPTAAASNLVFSNVTPASLTVAYTAATGSPSGYLVIRKTGSSPAFTPQQNTIYRQGQTVSDGVVAYVGTALTFNESGLSASTAYFYDVFAYNQNGSLISYQTIAPLEGSKTTFTAEPAAQPTALLFSDVTTSSVTVSFTAAIPAPSGYIALRKATSAPVSLPADGTAYTVSQTLGDATVAYVGSAVTFADGGLLPGTIYYYQLFAYNGSSDATNYFTTVSTSNAGSKTTVPNKPVLTAATGIQQNQFTVNWTTVVGATSYRLDVSKDNFVSKVSGFDDVTVSGTSAIVTGLETGTAYKYRLRAVNASGTSTSADELQQFTIPAAPILAVASEVSQTSFKANWTSVTGATGYFIDVSSVNNFATFATGYQNKSLAAVTSETITGLTSGTIYYYRIRSTNIGGTSLDSNPAGSQLLIPATPVGLDATNATSTSFKAKWLEVTGASEYRIDVTLASANFSPSLTGYTDKLTDEKGEQLVSDLALNTAYRYKIRAVNASGTSPSSATISVSTLVAGSSNPLSLSSPPSSILFTGTSIASSTEIAGGTAPYTVSLYYRKITASDYTIRPITTTIGFVFQTIIDASMLDDIGLEYYYKVTDANGTPKESSHGFIYHSITVNQKSIPTLSSGGQLKDYTIFSIPYVLADNDISSIFEELGKYEKPVWRLVRYQGGKNVDYTEGLTKIELGKGYWFNALNKTEINIGEGTVAKVTQSEPFKMRLEKDWNQIGDPFTFNIDWSDVLAANPSLSSKVDQTILEYDGTTTGFKESDVLKAWSGGFVFANETVELTLPVTLKNTLSSGRKGIAQQITSADLAHQEWFLPITLKHTHVEHTYGGLGMHPQASESKDVYDKQTLPRFGKYLEWNTRHDEFFNPWFARDVVPVASSHTWNFIAETDLEVGEAQLVWDGFSLGQNEAQLLLLDQSNQMLIDMKKIHQYKFDLRDKKSFRIYYSADEKSLHPDISMLGLAYPNPVNESTTIPFIVSEKMQVQISMYDLTGRKIKEVVNEMREPGFYTAQWDRTDVAGARVASGVYIYRMNCANTSPDKVNRIIVK